MFKKKQSIMRTLLVIFFLSIPQYVAADQEFNDVIIILDPNESDGEFGALMTALTLALHEKAAPIIVSGSLIRNFCTIIGNKDVIKAAEDVKAKLNEKNAISYQDEKVVASLVGLSQDDWYGYVHNTRDLVLLVPRKYIDANIDKAVTNVDEQVRKCGFEVGNGKRIDPLTPEKIVVYDSPVWNIEQAIEDMFLPKATSNASIPKWNIYIIGHGRPAKLLGQEKVDNELKPLDRLIEKYNGYIKEYNENIQKLIQERPVLQDIEKLEQQQREKIDELAKLEPVSKKLTKTQLEELEKAREKLTAELTKILEELKPKKDSSAYKDLQTFRAKIKTVAGQIADSQQKQKMLKNPAYHAESAKVAGLLFGDFARLITFFDTLPTTFLFYSTCFAVGRNQQFVNEILQKIKAKFWIATAGFPNLSLSIRSLAKVELSLDSNKNIAMKFPYSYRQFFSLLRLFFSEKGGEVFVKNVKKLSKEQRQADPLMVILQTLIQEVSVSQNNQPFIRIPNVGAFSALEAAEKVKILTSTVVRAHELEGKDIELRNCEFVFINTPRILVPVLLDYNVLVTMQSKSETYGGYLHEEPVLYFEKLIYPSVIGRLSSNLVAKNVESNTKILIKELHVGVNNNSGITHTSPCTLHSTSYSKCYKLDNVIITTLREPKPGKLNAGGIDISLMSAGEVYKAQWKRDDLTSDDYYSKDNPLFALATDQASAAEQHKKDFEKLAKDAGVEEKQAGEPEQKKLGTIFAKKAKEIAEKTLQEALTSKSERLPGLLDRMYKLGTIDMKEYETYLMKMPLDMKEVAVDILTKNTQDSKLAWKVKVAFGELLKKVQEDIKVEKEKVATEAKQAEEAEANKGEEEATDAKEEAKAAPLVLEKLSPGAEKVLTKIAEHNNCTREKAYAIFLKSLPDFTPNQPVRNKQRLSKHNLGLGTKQEAVNLAEYRTLRNEHKNITLEQRRKIQNDLRNLGITYPEHDALEEALAR